MITAAALVFGALITALICIKLEKYTAAMILLLIPGIVGIWVLTR